MLGVTESPAPEAEPVTFSDLVISDADVDGVMNEDVNGWDGFSVLTVEYEGQSIFYVIPENNSVDETKAIGSVVMNYDTNRVTSLNCQVDLTKLDMHKAQIEQLYTYFRDQFPFEVVSGLTEEAWSALQTQLDMSFDSAVAASATGTETRQLAGQFVFHVAKDLISLDFFVA